jgi:uncharacterized metal-binding protein YceD (DUF177 family)
MTPEFSRAYRLDTLSEQPRDVEVEARASEREALARRFGILRISRLSATAALMRSGSAVTATGVVRASATQSCVATGEPVEETIEEEFAIEFRPPAEGAGGEDEVELAEGELDVVFYEGAAIDFGEAVAETLSLSLDPFPRSPAAAAALVEAGVKSEDEAREGSSPFAALKSLKDKLKP